MKSPTDSLKVVCAVITNKANEVLACQRSTATSMAGKWEFPGGKIEAGESKENAISREIMEELGVSIHLNGELAIVEYQYTEFHISLHPFLCEITEGGEPQALEHEVIRWIDPNSALANDLDWADADRVILLEIQQLGEK